MAALPDADEWRRGDEEDMTTINDCYCPACQDGHAVTTMLPTKVPMFREIIIMNLTCDNCGFRNAAVSFGGEIQEQGCRITLTVTSPDDLNRQVVKADSATLFIPAVDLEIPPITQQGNVSTLEGILCTAADKLEGQQPERLRLGDVDNFHRCRKVIHGLRRLAGRAEPDNDDDDEPGEQKGEGSDKSSTVFPFQIIMDDPAGNSYIENLLAPAADPHLTKEFYYRTPSQDIALGLQPSQQAILDGTIDDANPAHKNVANADATHRTITVDKKPKKSNGNQQVEGDGNGDTEEADVGRQEVLQFQTLCPNCYKPTETDMCMTDIPHFKEVILMSMVCESCGFKSNEIKGGGAIPKFGTKITLTVQNMDDLAREVLKSDTAGISIPELELELEEGGLNGMYTTVEGLLQKLYDRLEQANPFGAGDAATKQHSTNDGGAFSQPAPTHVRYMSFLQKLADMGAGKVFPFTIVISDPLSNSFVGPIPNDAVALALQAERDGNKQCYDDYVDHGMQVEEYERTHEQNEILGLNDLKTENYHEDDGGEQPGYFGTDQMEELPDRIRRVDVRGPDHPHAVGKAPVEGDTTVMGPGSVNFAVPSMGKRGILGSTAATTSTNDDGNTLAQLLHEFEKNDAAYMMSENYCGSKPNLVYKDGAQGIGYYTDFPLLQLYQEKVLSKQQ